MQSEELITQQELAVIFPNGVPMPVMKMIFPEKSENLTVEDIRYILNAMRPEAALSAAEPVAWVYAPDLAKGSGGFGKEKGIVVMSLDGEWINVDTPLYAAPPAPSVAVKALQMADETFRDLGWHDKYEATTAALAALSAQVQDVAGWQPIETAPKDGTIILLFGGAYHPFPGYWELRRFNPTRPWVSVVNESRLYEHVPTHWMPLPAAPAKQEE